MGGGKWMGCVVGIGDVRRLSIADCDLGGVDGIGDVRRLSIADCDLGSSGVGTGG